MKILFITFAPLSSNAGHLSRLKHSLEFLSRKNEISILCLNTTKDETATLSQYPYIKFYNFGIKFNGWRVINIAQVSENILKIVKNDNIDLVVLQMEVWDLIRELSFKLRGYCGFSVCLHAMPFLAVPLNPSYSFVSDIKDYLKTNIPDYRKAYISDHYHEAKKVLTEIPIISMNKTVSKFIHNYFPKIRFYEINPNIRLNEGYYYNNNTKEYDFVYMARIEKGKGLEFIPDILEKTSKLLKRKVTMLIIGKIDDEFGKKSLDSLLHKQHGQTYRAEYLGWINDSQKKILLPKCKVFLYPSYYDTLAIVVKEALSFGLPVVAWDIDAIKINYRTPAVKKVKMFDINRFALEIVTTLNNLPTLSSLAYQYNKKLPTILDIIGEDQRVYEKIINDQTNK